MSSLGIKLRKLMLDHGLNQTQFGKRIGVTQAHISAIVNDRTKPGFSIMKKITEEFNVEYDFFDEESVTTAVKEPQAEYHIESNPFADVLQWMNKIEMRMAALEKDHVIT